MTDVKYILSADELDRMTEIELESFAVAWTKEDIKACVSSDGVLRTLGVYEDGRLQGWGCFSMALNEAHLLTIAVSPISRRRGLGRALMLGLIQAAADAGADHMELECRSKNISALGLYKSLGFFRVGVKRNYYPNDGDDALILVKIDMPKGASENDPYLIRA